MELKVIIGAVIVAASTLGVSNGYSQSVHNAPTFTQVDLNKSTFTYFSAYEATEIKGIQFIENHHNRKDLVRDILNRTQVVVALNSSKVPVRFLEITENATNKHSISFLSNIGFGSNLGKTRIGSHPNGVSVLPQYTGKNVKVQEITGPLSTKELQIFGDDYLRSATYDNKLLLLSSNSIKLIDTDSEKSSVKVLADAKLVNPDKLQDMSLEVVDDCIIQIGKRQNSPEYVVTLFELKSINGVVEIKKKHAVSLPFEILRAKPLQKDLSRLIVSTPKSVFEFHWDVTDRCVRRLLKLRTDSGKQVIGINHVICEDDLVLFGADTGVYYATIWDDAESDIRVYQCPGSKSAKVSQLALSKSDYLVAGYKLTNNNSQLIAAWKLNH